MNESMLSVGIDLGTSTTQMVISELTIKNMASAFTIPRVEITDKKILYSSDIIFTPLVSPDIIDVEKIKDFLDLQYKKSGFKRDDIQIGAVIITGETARKDNASVVLQAMSGYAGDFVVATAGPDLESIIAGKGAGAQQYSKKYHTSVANLDIGGGTTNISLFKDDDLIDTACFDIGGRLIRIDKKTEKIVYISPKLEKIIEKEKYPVHVGMKASPENLKPVISVLVRALEESVGIGQMCENTEILITNKSLKQNQEIECLSFSGGVADCIFNDYSEDIFKYGDIGVLLGRAITSSKLMTEKKIIDSSETIRATVVGAGSHTTKVSGSTIAYTEKILPIKNIPVAKLADSELNDLENLPKAIEEKINWFAVDGEIQAIALGFEGYKNPTFRQIDSLAQEIVNGSQNLIKKSLPLVIIVNADNGKSLGHAIQAKLPKSYPFVCIDTIKVENGDYVDIGMPVAQGEVLPVVVKTLVFE